MPRVRRQYAGIMRSVYQAESIVDAQLVCDALTSVGIPAYVTGAHLTGAAGGLPALGLVRVVVPEPSAADAEAVVARVETLLSESRGALDEAPGNEPLPAS